VLADFQSVPPTGVPGDQLRLHGRESDYAVGSSPVAGLAGAALFLDSNGNRRADGQDELIAVAPGLSRESLQWAVAEARFV
jgi:hypothetical protein